MRLNIYVPNQLAAQLREHPGMNVSAVCQEALTRALRATAPAPAPHSICHAPTRAPQEIR